MNRRICQLLPLVLVGGSATCAMAQQPPDPVASDSLNNTAMGTGALQNQGSIYSVGAYDNTAVGYNALVSSYNGAYNTAVGAFTLAYDTSGSENTAVGESALSFSLTSNNTAVGYNALEFNTMGGQNSALGAFALQNDGSGGNNTALGYDALLQNQSGSQNTAIGASALQNNLGDGNTALGYQALYNNTSGVSNAAIGSVAAYNTTSGQNNLAIGVGALFNNESGSGNIAIGYYADTYYSGVNDIDIGSGSEETDNGIIRIGSPGSQTVVRIAGVERTKVTGSAVYVTSTGQLGVLASSERYKTDIAPIGASDKLSALRPVTFHLKTAPAGPVQYGLIAEEVAHVYPELVIRNDTGVIQGVRYDELAPLLLNALQQRRRQVAVQDEAIRRLQQQVTRLDAINQQRAP